MNEALAAIISVLVAVVAFVVGRFTSGRGNDHSGNSGRADDALDRATGDLERVKGAAGRIDDTLGDSQAGAESLEGSLAAVEDGLGHTEDGLGQLDANLGRIGELVGELARRAEQDD